MQENLKNRTIFCHDNLDVCRGINSDSIDLIYLDPPFNKKKTFDAPIGSHAEGASFRDIFYREDVKDEWIKDIEEDYYSIHELLNAVKNIEGRTSYNFCYLAYMAIRLLECHRILKDIGSLYLHCDPTMSHYLKLLSDCIFGEKNFRNEIVWCYDTGGVGKKWFSKKHDILLFYTKTEKYNFNIDMVRGEYKEKAKVKYKVIDDKKYLRKNPQGKSPQDYWLISSITNTAKERTGYPTQKPIALLERIIKASSNEGEIVLDPFCGCATTCVAARTARTTMGRD